MGNLHHCPSCRCLNPEGPKLWATQHLIHTGDPADRITMGTAWLHYMRWFGESDKTTLFYRQNSLTRWLRESGCRIERLDGRGNQLIGYRLAP